MSDSLSRKLTNIFSASKESLAHLLFPEICLVCDGELPKESKNLCSFCEENLPLTHFEENNENGPAAQLFWGRVKIDHVFAWLTYQRETATQTLLHQIKYKDKPQLAVALGEKLGEQLKNLQLSGKNMKTCLHITGM